MKIALASDLHLEFGEISLENYQGADVLILSGDICVASKFRDKDRKFFRECSESFPKVIYIMGNHEHYNGNFVLTENLLREELEDFENIHLLEKQSVDIGDYTFVGATIWTDMNKNDPNTLWHVNRVMNDFRIISHPNGFYERLTPEIVQEIHNDTMEYIRGVVDANPNGKFVIVGHHAPSKQSVKPRYQGDHLVNGAYSSDLSEFILDRPQIKVWTHGHTHDTFDYMVGTTRVLCNPRGYIYYEDRADDFKLEFYEL
jgi:predicted phosphodiesterase